MKVWARFISIKIRFSGCEHSNEPVGSVKGVFLTAEWY
jgi:hypothetical protein